MKNWSIGKLDHWATVFLLLFSCANPMTPTGGERDTTPPKIKTTSPANKSTYCKPEKITVEFDEYFILDNPSQNITISPPIEGDLKYVSKGKSLLIKFPKDSALLENTTYTIRFGAAIKDNNEGNVQDSFSYVFSTGRYLDSLRFSGSVIQAETGAPEDGFLVGLYFSTNDSTPYKKKPDYYAKTNKNGLFSLENLKPGTYRVFGIKDENYSYTKDLPNERIAFMKNEVSLNDSTPPIVLKSFPDESKLRITDIETKALAQIRIILSDRADSVSLKSFSEMLSLENVHYQYNEKQDTVVIHYGYNTAKQDSFIIYLNGKPTDTIQLNFKTTNRDSIRMNLPPPGLFSPAAGSGKKTLSAAPKISYNIDYFSPLVIKWSRPVVSRETDSVKIFAIKDTTKTEISGFTVEKDEKLLWKIYPKNNLWQQGLNYELHIPDSIIHDYFGLFNKSMNISFATSKMEDYGETNVKIDSLDAEISYLLELSDGKSTIVSRETLMGEKTQSFRYQQLSPGGYKLKLIEDLNNNGKWDTGDYFKKQQPENIIFFPENIDIRAKWENEVIFNIKGKKKL